MSRGLFIGEEAEKVMLDQEESVNSLKIDIESLKIVLRNLVTDFEKKFQRAKNCLKRSRSLVDE